MVGALFNFLVQQDPLEAHSRHAQRVTRDRRNESCLPEHSFLPWHQLFGLLLSRHHLSFNSLLFSQCFIPFFLNNLLLNFCDKPSYLFFHLCFSLSCMAFTYSLSAQECVSVKLSQSHTKVINKNVPWVTHSFEFHWIFIRLLPDHFSSLSKFFQMTAWLFGVSATCPGFASSSNLLGYTLPRHPDH